MRSNQTVVRYQDGRVLKGYTYNLSPGKYHFHLFPAGDPGARGTEVWLRDVKAVFFTRDLTGDPSYHERKEFTDEEKTGFRKVRVTFSDGEILAGYTTRYDSGGNGFYFAPADRQSNNIRVFAVFAALRQISYVDSAGRDAAPPDPPAPAAVSAAA